MVALAHWGVGVCKTKEVWATFSNAPPRPAPHSKPPPPPPHQRRFHKVMAENMAAKRFAAVKVRQPCVLRKCAHANDGIVAPVIAFGAMPPRDACGDQRAV